MRAHSSREAHLCAPVHCWCGAFWSIQPPLPQTPLHIATLMVMGRLHRGSRAVGDISKAAINKQTFPNWQQRLILNSSTITRVQAEHKLSATSSSVPFKRSRRGSSAHSHRIASWLSCTCPKTSALAY